MTTVKRDPKELAEAIRKECEIKEEYKQKLTPFVEAGWNWNGVNAYKPLACDNVFASYDEGQFKLQFPRQPSESFDSADDALKYVAEVEKQLAEH